MLKPNDFDQVQAFEGFTPLAVGGHICSIVQVNETKSKAGRDMVVILLDTDKTDSQPHYFKERFDNNTNPQKKWPNGAIIRQLVLDSDGNTNRGFKTFCEMVEKSNPGFKIQWGDNFATGFKNKLVGVVFGREEYLNSYGESKFATKAQNFRTVEEVKRGIEPPKDNLLNPGSNNQNGPDTFPDITPVDDGDLPF